MNEFSEFLDSIADDFVRKRTEDILVHISETFFELKREMKWNQPMFIDHGTFIFALSVSKKHISLAPEAVVIEHFKEEINKAGYEATKEIIRLPHKKEVDFNLIDDIIRYNIFEKKDMNRFWR